ncbi:hypothetical protein HNR39_002547 [Glaciimonas immobilis]|uniref:Uncharacterized protein n=1 Tax=Glaciimonas immobilis TaxID=728004 RepID=A0A840RSD3_9BURK|nr:hypothetical protein [Glaciimonas immobilis]
MSSSRTLCAYANTLDKHLIETCPKRNFQNLYNETDFTFFSPADCF